MDYFEGSMVEWLHDSFKYAVLVYTIIRDTLQNHVCSWMVTFFESGNQLRRFTGLPTINCNILLIEIFSSVNRIPLYWLSAYFANRRFEFSILLFFSTIAVSNCTVLRTTRLFLRIRPLMRHIFLWDIIFCFRSEFHRILASTVLMACCVRTVRGQWNYWWSLTSPVSSKYLMAW